MFDDPIVTEVRETREKLLVEAGGFEPYVQKLKAMEKQDVERLVRRPIVSRETRPQGVKHKAKRETRSCVKKGTVKS